MISRTILLEKQDWNYFHTSHCFNTNLLILYITLTCLMKLKWLPLKNKHLPTVITLCHLRYIHISSPNILVLFFWTCNDWVTSDTRESKLFPFNGVYHIFYWKLKKNAYVYLYVFSINIDVDISLSLLICRYLWDTSLKRVQCEQPFLE